MNASPRSPSSWVYVLWSVAIVVVTVAVTYLFEIKISG